MGKTKETKEIKVACNESPLLISIFKTKTIILC